MSEVNFLGHLISDKGIKKSPEFIEKILNIQKPTTVKEMRQFIGMVNFQRKFIKNCSLFLKPLTEWTVGARTRKIAWNDEMEVSFEALKAEVAKDVMLAHPDYGEGAEKLKLFVDASGKGAGACLMQKQGSEQRVIAYSSMLFSDTQSRYSTTDRELTALRWGMKNLKGFLLGVPFIVYTDHKSLIYMHNMAINNSRLMRTIQDLAEFDFEI